MNWEAGDNASDTACCDVCDSCSRLLKSASVRYGNVTSTSIYSRPRNILRRIDLSPATGNDENAHPAFAEPYDAEMPAVASPPPVASSPSKFAIMRQQQGSVSYRHRQPLEDYDPNSQDSGYGAEKCDPKTGFRFAEPFGLAPRRQLTDQSPRKENWTSPRSKSVSHILPPKLYNSQSCSSGSESTDDGFIEFFDYKCDEDANLPTSLTSLFQKPICLENTSPAVQETEEKPRLSFRRSLSLVETNTPTLSRARSCLFGGSLMQQGDLSVSPSNNGRPFKRPEPPCEYGTGQAKRRKSSPFHDISANIVSADENLFPKTGLKKPAAKQNRCLESEATIMTALHRSSQVPDLIGDLTVPHILPLMDGRHQDLKTISHETLAHLLEGRFSSEIDSFSIVDCRYPYEFDGGHIRGAKNVYTRDQVLKDFVTAVEATSEATNTAKRKRIVVFHCEFSSERGPALYRYLRNCDRDQNKECYPSLFYPELYLLNGGYKLFFENHSQLCEPQAYRPMLHPNHETELRIFRAKSKSWNGDGKSRLALRNNLKRLGI